MNDHAAADNRHLAAHRHYLVGQLQMRLARAVRFNIAKISLVTLCVVMSGMRIFRWIEMTARGCRIRRRAIAEFVNVKAMLAWR